ncbi:MAG: aldehyde dehydrogenase family protein [Candidatus Methanoplasma sp.]|jgi:acyl-CoA reductase-like NAD-dependent aldehyde dehydrogenase|nr:aldehyde dehydrogenase family protein [Candidatus Methanoplasma sp.]
MAGDSSRTYDDAKFEAAFQTVLQLEKKDYPSYIGGFQIASGNEFPIASPIDSSIKFGFFQEPEKGIAARAVEASLETFSTWSKIPADERAAYFEKVLELVRVQRYRLASIVLLSSGMTRQASVAEVDRLIAILENEIKKVKENKAGKPTGVWGILTSFNSPLASPIGYAAAAILAGNTAVVIPSRTCPVPVYQLYGIFEKAGLPGGVLNLIVDRKDDPSEELAEDPRLAGLVASGTGKNLDDLMFLQIDDELRFVNEIKGMNPILVHRPADIKKAAKDVLESAFAYSGQRLYSSSKVIITIAEQQKFTDALLDQAKNIKIGDPADIDTYAGPIISEPRLKEFLTLAESLRGRILFGGKRVNDEFTQNGSYVTPLIISATTDEEDEISYIDSGFPILAIQIVADDEAAIEEAVYTERGLSVGVFSKDTRFLDKIKEEVDVPYIFVNESSLSLEPALEARVETFTK